MAAGSLHFERTYQAPIEEVWSAITDNDKMKKWYFDIPEFRPEVGFQFTFYGESDNIKFLHLCTVTEVDPPRLLAYSWRYEDFPGESVVTFELTAIDEETTRLQLTHTGIESFPQDKPFFRPSSFTEGWTYILGKSLKDFVEKVYIQKSVTIRASAEKIWQVLLSPDNSWGSAFGGGAFAETSWQEGAPIIWKDLSGDIGANGKVIENKPGSILHMRYYDNLSPAADAELGSYSEILRLKTVGNDSWLLEVETGLLDKEDAPEHSAMWEEAVDIIRRHSENS